MNMNSKLLIPLFASAFCLAVSAANLTGKYKGTLSRPNGEDIQINMELKQEGNKVTGKVSSPGGEAEIHEGKVEGEKLTYLVKYERDGNTTTVKNTGKIVGDSIEGKAEFEREGETISREWKVKKQPAAGNFSGKWKSSFTRQDGNTMEITYNLKQDGSKITGSTSSTFGEAEIADGSVTGNEIAFTIKRERDGRSFTSKYSGKLDGNKIVGKSESDFGGQTRTREWEASRQN
jgi:hypothetical protein